MRKWFDWLNFTGDWLDLEKTLLDLFDINLVLDFFMLGLDMMVENDGIWSFFFLNKSFWSIRYFEPPGVLLNSRAWLDSCDWSFWSSDSSSELKDMLSDDESQIWLFVFWRYDCSSLWLIEFWLIFFLDCMLFLLFRWESLILNNDSILSSKFFVEACPFLYLYFFYSFSFVSLLKLLS